MRKWLNHLTVAVGLTTAGSIPLAIGAPLPDLRAPQLEAASTSAPAWERGQQIDTLRAAVQNYLEVLHHDGDFPGVSVGIAFPDGSTLHFASGVADEATGAPLSSDSRFLAGSVGKTFFSALALQLVQEGRLGLDWPISRFLGDDPWFERLPNARDITVRMLLNHTSGLVRYEFDPRVAEAITSDRDKVWTGEERLSYLLDTEAPFAAGEDWTYSDTNYIVLAMILPGATRRNSNPKIDRSSGSDDRGQHGGRPTIGSGAHQDVMSAGRPDTPCCSPADRAADRQVQQPCPCRVCVEVTSRGVERSPRRSA
jgi:CubicO group peptidase (beta-lactamase class C family)